MVLGVRGVSSLLSPFSQSEDDSGDVARVELEVFTDLTLGIVVDIKNFWVSGSELWRA